MKKGYIFFVLLLLVAGMQTAWAQSVVVKLANNRTVVYSVSELDSISITETSSHDWVDLGLPSGTLWATCNIGAHSPEEYGDYFAWGETKPKSDYSWETYALCKGTYNSITKYCLQSTYGFNGFTDNLRDLEPEHDAAIANWGEEWEMPSDMQFDELMNDEYTIVTDEYEDGDEEKYVGKRITSKINGNSILFPPAGHRQGTTLNGDGACGYYQSRSLSVYYSCDCFSLDAYPYYLYVSGNSRIDGCSVRPVRFRPHVKVEEIVLDKTEFTFFEIGKTEHIATTVLPEGANNKYVVWESSDDAVATVSSSGHVKSVSNGTCIITCRATDGSGVTAQCTVTVQESRGSIDGREWVNLGLPSGTLWATCNVGAQNPEDFGNHYAWGETQPKADYSEATYKYMTGTQYFMLTKYCDQSRNGVNGFTDDLTELLPEDDAATANWSAAWQTPSYEQCQELFDNNYTTLERTTQNGVNGVIVRSKINNEIIFLPGAGTYQYTHSYYVGNDGCYWSRSLVPEYSCLYAGYMFFEHEDLHYGTGAYYRYFGRSVRPVCKQGPISVQSIVLSVEKISLEVGMSAPLETVVTATVLPASAANKEVTWESTDVNVFTIDQNNNFKALTPGKCSIICRATDGSGVTAECRVNVFGFSGGDDDPWE